jgi:hypothetical protein
VGGAAIRDQPRLTKLVEITKTYEKSQSTSPGFDLNAFLMQDLSGLIL